MTKAKEKMIFWTVALFLFIYFLGMVSDILLPFVVGILVAYFLDPAADRLEKFGLSRASATSLIIGVFFVVVIALCALVAPLIYDQFVSLVQNIPDYVRNLQEKTAPFVSKITEKIDPDSVEKAKAAASDVSGYVVTFSGKLLANIWESGMAFFNVISLIFISPVVSFYLLRDWDKLIAKVDMWIPRKHVKEVRQQLHLIDETLSGYIRGQSNVCILLGVFYAVGLSLVGLEYGLVIGLATGILAFIPFVGLFIGMATGLIVAFFQFGGDMTSISMVLGVFIVGQLLEGNFVTPKLVGEKVGLHAVWVIFGLLAGGALFGFTGILLAVPVTAIIGVLARFALCKYMESPFYETDKKPVPKRKLAAKKKTPVKAK